MHACACGFHRRGCRRDPGFRGEPALGKSRCSPVVDLGLYKAGFGFGEPCLGFRKPRFSFLQPRPRVIERDTASAGVQRTHHLAFRDHLAAAQRRADHSARGLCTDIDLSDRFGPPPQDNGTVHTAGGGFHRDDGDHGLGHVRGFGGGFLDFVRRVGLRLGNAREFQKAVTLEHKQEQRHDNQQGRQDRKEPHAQNSSFNPSSIGTRLA